MAASLPTNLLPSPPSGSLLLPSLKPLRSWSLVSKSLVCQLPEPSIYKVPQRQPAKSSANQLDGHPEHQQASFVDSQLVT
eukprot:superscaffoldBa00003738_g17589